MKISATAVVLVTLAAAGSGRADDAQTQVVDPVVAYVPESEPIAVLDRPRPAYDPVGIRSGGFIFYPALAGAIFYNDNVNVSSNGDKDASFEYHVAPELKVKSDWSRHAFEAYAGIDAVAYSDASDYDHVNALVGAKGRIDVLSDLAILPSVEYRRDMLQPGDPDSLVTVDDPVMRDVLEGKLAISKSFNRLWIAGGVGAARVNFDEFSDVDYSNDEFIDYTVYSASARVGYKISPLTSVFTEVSYNRRDFDDGYYNSDGYQAIAGVQFEASRLVQGEAYAGYLVQDYDAAELQNISTFTFGGKLRWFVSPLWTVTLTGAREAGESTYADGSSLVMTTGGVKVDYELLRNLIISGGVRYIDNNYQDAERKDETWQARVSAKYLINRHLNISLDYKYTDFSTNAVDVDSYTQNIYGATIRFQY